MKSSLLLLGIVCTVLIAGCAGSSTGGQSSQTGVSACPDLKIIGDFVSYNSSIGRFITDTKSTEFDGYLLTQASCCQYSRTYTLCELGSRAGENSSNYYCRGIVAKKYDESGNVIDSKTLTVVLSSRFG